MRRAIVDIRLPVHKSIMQHTKLENTAKYRTNPIPMNNRCNCSEGHCIVPHDMHRTLDHESHTCIPSMCWCHRQSPESAVYVGFEHRKWPLHEHMLVKDKHVVWLAFAPRLCRPRSARLQRRGLGFHILASRPVVWTR